VQLESCLLTKQSKNETSYPQDPRYCIPTPPFHKEILREAAIAKSPMPEIHLYPTYDAFSYSFNQYSSQLPYFGTQASLVTRAIYSAVFISIGMDSFWSHETQASPALRLPLPMWDDHRIPDPKHLSSLFSRTLKFQK
jgi:hypothetical protein